MNAKITTMKIAHVIWLKMAGLLEMLKRNRTIKNKK